MKKFAVLMNIVLVLGVRNGRKTKKLNRGGRGGRREKKERCSLFPLRSSRPLRFVLFFAIP
jgi:hypothetical protein